MTTTSNPQREQVAAIKRMYHDRYRLVDIADRLELPDETVQEVIQRIRTEKKLPKKERYLRARKSLSSRLGMV